MKQLNHRKTKIDLNVLPWFGEGPSFGQRILASELRTLNAVIRKTICRMKRIILFSWLKPVIKYSDGDRYVSSLRLNVVATVNILPTFISFNNWKFYERCSYSAKRGVWYIWWAVRVSVRLYLIIPWSAWKFKWLFFKHENSKARVLSSEYQSLMSEPYIFQEEMLLLDCPACQYSPSPDDNVSS